MKPWPALSFAQEPEHLREFSHYLKQLGFPHRISEDQGQLTLWVFHPDHVAWLQQQYAFFEQGQRPEMPLTPPEHKVKIAWVDYPVTLLMIVLSCLGFLVVFLNWDSGLYYLSFQGFSGSAQTLQINSFNQWLALMQEGQWWRLITPIFLHFGWVHLGFNVVVFGFFASQIEQQKGKLFLLSCVLLTALLSNGVQYAFSPLVLFGGLSGVAYGLIGYCAVSNFRSQSQNVYVCPPGLFYFSIIMIALGFTDAFALFGLSMANWAHSAGFITGCLIAVLSRLPAAVQSKEI